MKVVLVQPDPECSMCRGTGEVCDWVDYGSTVVPLRSACECVERQVEDDDAEIEIVQLPVKIKRGQPSEFFD